jgi:hypothetical protein
MEDSTRPVCRTEGCDNPARKHGHRNGKQRYAALCNSCEHRKRPRRPPKMGRLPILNRTQFEKNALRKDACERCGWAEAVCDVHRIAPGGPYTASNTVTLCPNCHRLVTMNLAQFP